MAGDCLLPQEQLAQLSAADGLSPHDSILQTDRFHIEIIPFYAPVGTADFHPPFDGTHIATGVLALLPTSCGTATLADTSPASAPVIDLHYLETAIDCEALRSGLRMAMRAMETEAGTSMVVGETPPQASSH